MEAPGPLPRSTRDPHIEILELKEDFIKFVLTHTDTSMANALRRVMIAETPTMAIDLVEIEHNSSVLHDEFVAHRLGLLPIRLEASEGMHAMKYRRECFCDGECPQCSLVFNLDVSNDDPNEPQLIVASSDLRPETERARAVDFSSADEEDAVKEATPNLPLGVTIAKLAPGQRLKCRCVATKGVSKIHAKWCPVSVATFAYDPKVELNDARMDLLSEAQKREFVDICPAEVFKLDKQTNKIVVDKREACTFCDECVKLGELWRTSTEDDNVVAVSAEPNRFIFSVETTGALRPEECVYSALRVLQEKLQVLRAELDKINKSGESIVELGFGQAGFVDTGGFI